MKFYDTQSVIEQMTPMDDSFLRAHVFMKTNVFHAFARVLNISKKERGKRECQVYIKAM